MRGQTARIHLGEHLEEITFLVEIKIDAYYNILSTSASPAAAAVAGSNHQFAENHAQRFECKMSQCPR